MVGSIALDSVKTPFGSHQNLLGGSSVYFSVAASFFSPVWLVGVVGRDFPKRHISLLKSRGIDLKGLQVSDGKTFRWRGHYEHDLGEAKTLETQLNVFARFHPVLPAEYKKAPYLFLANIDPDLQRQVLSHVEGQRFVAADTMNLWIQTKRKSLLRLIRKVDLLIVNEGEARMLSRKPHLVQAGRMILTRGPRYVVIKKGEHGSMLFTRRQITSVPAYPLEEVVDPTGAGDSFAGGMMGYLAAKNQAKDGRISEMALRRAMVFGSAMASFTVQDFSLRRLSGVSRADVLKRYQEIQTMAGLVSMGD